MLRALDLFPYEAPADCAMPIQGRIIIRNHPFRLIPPDVQQFIATGTIKATDDPDEAQDLASHGFR